EGRYVDDIKLPGLLHAAFVRSPHAHARVMAIRTDAAARTPGVARVLTFADVAPWMKPLPLFGAVPPGLAARVHAAMRARSSRGGPRRAGRGPRTRASGSRWTTSRCRPSSIRWPRRSRERRGS